MVKPILNTSALAMAISVALALATPSFAESWSALGGGILPIDGGQFPNIDESVYGLNLSILCGRNQNMFGLSVASIGHHVDAEAAGIQISGVYSSAKSASEGLLQVGLGNYIVDVGMGMQIGAVNLARDYTGLQVGAMNCAENDLKGLQIGAVNVRRKDLYNAMARFFGDFTGGWAGAFYGGGVGKFTGVQIGAANSVGGDCIGSQIGAVNFVDDNMQGVQIGAVNAARTVAGAQIGGFNWTREMHGVQIGAVNVVVRQFSGVAIGAINILYDADAMLLPVVRASF